jgi:3-dehydroquinate dehydratase type I
MKEVFVKNVVIGRTPLLVCTVLEADPHSILIEARKSISAGADLVEVRVDKLKSNDEIAVLSQIDLPTIVSCRSPAAMGFFEGSEKERADRLIYALEMGADILDVELTMEDNVKKMIMTEAKARNVPVLMGYENMKESPGLDFLIEKAKEIRDHHPDIAKIAVKANSFEDMVTILQLTLACNSIFDIPFAAIAVGKYGSASRPLACVLGSSMTYCTTKKSEEAPPGQLSVEDTRAIIRILS